MLNTPTDYHTFDRVTVKKVLRNNTYKWSCLTVSLLLCALMVMMWYWNEMMERPQKFVKLDRSMHGKSTNNTSMDRDELLNRVRETMGVAAEKGEILLTTLIDEAEGIADQVKAGVDSLRGSGAEIVDSTGNQLKEIADTAGDRVNEIVDTAADNLSQLATGVGDEVEQLIATTIDQIEDALDEAKQAAQEAAQDAAPSSNQ